MNSGSETAQVSPAVGGGFLSRIRDFRERLACRPDSEHEQTLIRVILVSIASIYLMYYIRKDGQIIPQERLSV